MKINISPARVAAYKVLYDVLQNGAFSNISLNRHLNPQVKNETDRALATNIVYGTIKKMHRLESVLQKFIKSRVSEADIRLRIILSMSLYQIMYLDKIPEYALVNDAVNITKLYVETSKGAFVNGVLRNILRYTDSIKEIKDTGKDDFYRYMFLEYGVKRDIVKIYLKSMSRKELIELFKAFEMPPQIFVRINTQKISRDELIDILEKENFHTAETISENAIQVNGSKNIFCSKAFKDGLFFAQDLSGVIAGEVLSPDEEDTVLDICAAPGGKSFNAALFASKGHVTALDKYANKLKMLKNTASQLGLTNINVYRRNAVEVYSEDFECYDKVICDVPCSGLGVVRRKPEILFRLTTSHIKTLISLQHRILQNAAKYVKAGGILLYSTCTMNIDENIHQVEKFLEENPMFSLEKIDIDYLSETHKEMQQGYLQLNPVIDGCDGFFMAKMKKEPRRIDL